MHQRANRTNGPIPVRRRSLVTALFGERVFKALEIISVPWEEQTSEVDLFFGLRAVIARDNTERTT